MKFALPIALLAFVLFLPPVQGGQAASPVQERVYIGMVVRDRAVAQEGMRVLSVAPGSPACKAGIRTGDMVLSAGGEKVSDRGALRRIVRDGVSGQSFPVELLRGGKRLVLNVVLEARPASSPSRGVVVAPMGVDRHIYPIRLSDDIRQQMRSRRRVLREQLASLPDGLQPDLVTRELQAIRDLARDAQAGLPGWMSGRAGEISIRFRDEEGSVVLYGASNQLELELYNLDGLLIARYELHSQAGRLAIPQHVLERLHRLR